MPREIRFRIVLDHPPAGVDFGLQQGRGQKAHAVQVQRSTGADLVFEFAADLKTPSAIVPVLLGQFVQGPPDQRFVYIVIGVLAGQTGSPWNRRLKIPLSPLSHLQIDTVQTSPYAILETRVPGKASDGGPNCATVKNFSGWSLARTDRPPLL